MKGGRQRGSQSSVPVPVCSRNVWTRMGLLHLSVGQTRCMHLPLAVRWREESVVRSTSLCPAENISLPFLSTQFVLSILQVPPWMHGCSDYVSTTLLPFIPHPALQSSPPHPAFQLIQALFLALHWHCPPRDCENLFLLKHETSLTPATCQLSLDTLKSHPLIECSAHLACLSAAVGAMTGGQAFLLHPIAQ